MKRWMGALLCLSLVQIPGFPSLSTQRVVVAQIEIRAPLDLVWSVVIGFPAYDTWNPYIYPVKGTLRVGHPLEVTLHTNDGLLTYAPVVLTVRPKRELSWGGRIPNGLFERVQTFTLTEVAPGRVRLISREGFTGLLLPLYSRIPDGAQRGLDEMNRALRTRAELLTFSQRNTPVHLTTGHGDTIGQGRFGAR